MPDYSLGRAHGKIEIEYDGRDAAKASRDLEAVGDASSGADKKLTDLNTRVQDSQDRFVSQSKAVGEATAATEKFADETEHVTETIQDANTAADGYRRRLQDVEDASRAAELAERNHRTALLDSKASLDDIKDAEDKATEARKRHTQATDAARDAHSAFNGDMDDGRRGLSAMASTLSSLASGMLGFGDASGSANPKVKALKQSTDGLSGALNTAAGAALALGQPQVAAGLKVAAIGIDTMTASTGALVDVVKGLAGFEVAFGKISGAVLGIDALGGLAGIGGAAGAQGIVNVAGAVQQLSGVLGLLPATVAGIGFSMSTLELAFRGVGDALGSMMDDDPTKFLESIKNMAPVAGQALLAVAAFRDEFKMAAAAPQESFFLQIADQIKPLIEMWLPAIASGMSQVAGIFGQGASMLMQLLQQPAAMAAFQAFITNISAGLQAMLPAIQPIVEMFSQMVVVGSSFFGQIGDSITQVANSINTLVQDASASGELQSWIQSGINGFGHLVNIIASGGKAFLDIMTIADQFGGGGLLGWLDEISVAFANWTSSTEGQSVLTEFFSTMRTATDAFIPLLGPLVEGLASIGGAFVQLGTATAPGFQVLLDVFADTMEQLGPQIAATAPALNTFLTGLAGAFSQLMAQVGPELPRIFQMLADGFVALLPQIAPLTAMFLELAVIVGPHLAEMFGAITSVIFELMPYFPILAVAIGVVIDVITFFIEVVAGAVWTFTDFVEGIRNFIGEIPDAFSGVMDAITSFFAGLPGRALDAGKNLIGGLVEGITSGLGSVGGATRAVVEAIAEFFQSSPAKQGPFSGAGYTMIRGQKMITDMAAGMSSAQPALEAAASSTATAASRGLSGGAPSPTGRETAGGALLPDNIAGADTSVLTEYLRHQFSDGHGLKGLARDLGEMLDVAQSGFDLLNTHAMQPLFETLGLLPGAKDPGWRKLSPKEMAAQQESDLLKDAQSGTDKPSWSDVLGPGADSGTGGAQVPLGLSDASSKSDIQKAIIAAGKSRGLDDSAIQTALAVAAAESGFNPTISGGVQGSAGLVSGLYQQSPSSGWGTLDQVNDPNYAINAFYDAFAKNLAKNPTNPQLAAVLTQNPQLGSDAQGSKYWGDVSAQLGLADSIMSSLGKDIKGPSWQQVAGGPPAPKAGAQSGGTYGLPADTNTGGYGTGTSDVFPPWVMALAKQFNIKPSTYADHQTDDRPDEPGYAPNPNGLNRGIDWTGATGDLQRFAKYLEANAGTMQGLEQIIWENPTTHEKVGLGGRGNLQDSYYPQSTYDAHGGNDPDNIHVHTRQSAPLALPSNPAVLNGLGTDPAAALPDDRRAAIDQLAAINGTSTNSGRVGDPTASPFYKPDDIVLPTGGTVDQLLADTTKSATSSEKLLQAYLDGNPMLAGQLAAAQVPGAADATVMGALGGISSTINDLTAQDPVGNKNTIDALRSQQGQLAQQQGFTQQPNGLQQAQSIAGGAAGAITGVFKSISSGLDALTATQDIADRLVYGIRNTDDINKVIDNVQKYITFAADIVSTVGSIMSTAGSFTGGSDFGGTSAAGSILSLVAGAMQGVNAAIDFGQQVYEVVMGYVGRFMTVLTGLGGAEMMGNVGFLLNTKTGQLQSYSQDNPENKSTMNVPGWMNDLYGYGKGNSNPQVSKQLNVYAGPGQSIGDVMNEVVWQVNTQGTTGAMAAEYF